MAASIFESPLLSKRFPTGEAGRLFTDAAEVRALLLVTGSLAKAQGEMGLVPEDSAFFIHRSAMEVQIDPAGLAKGVTDDADVVRHMADAFATAMEAPEHSQYILTDVAPMDIARTGRILRLRQLLRLCETALEARTETAAQTQAAKLDGLREKTLILSLGETAPDALRDKLATALRLRNPMEPWPTDESPLVAIAGWLADTCALAAGFAGPRAADRQSLARLCAALNEALAASPAQMTSACLPQIGLCTMSTLLLLEATP